MKYRYSESLFIVESDYSKIEKRVNESAFTICTSEIAVQPHFVKITSFGFNNNCSLNYSCYCVGPNLGHGHSVTYA